MQATSGTDSATASLVREARQGGQRAFQGLVDRYHDAIFRTVYYRVRCQADAEDLTQDIFIQAFRRLPGLKDETRFRSWLYRIAVNRIRDHLRRKRFRALFVSADADSAPDPPLPEDSPGQPAEVEREMARREFWRRIGNVLDRFSRMEREVFLLRFFDGLSIREIAQVVRKSESTVKTHLYRGIRKFKASALARQLLEETMS